MDSCNSSPAPELSPEVGRIMDEVFESLLPTNEDESSFTHTESAVEKTVEQAKSSSNSLDLNINSTDSPAVTKYDSSNIMAMDIELEDGTIIPGSNTAVLVNDVNETQKKKTRKRIRNPDSWKQNVRKKKREAGQEYEDIKRNLHEKKRIKFSCSCKYQCSKKITEEDRARIHEAFWKLSDTKKGHFYSENIKRTLTARKRTKSEQSRKSYSFYYYFNVDNITIRVCKKFFLGTLDISSQRIQYFFKYVQDKHSSVSRSPLKGKNVKKKISDEKKNEVREHIRSFPAVESHYCRASTSKTYLESNLNVSKMYSLYCQTTQHPVKLYMYRNIFDKEFNIAFHKPKKDLCEKCIEFEDNNNKTENDILAHEKHLKRKKESKEERDKDRVNKDPLTAIVTFDMENVFCLPKTNIGSQFYKQKLICYNLTAHCNISKVVYCSIWNEGICGRGGVHLANAVIKILKSLVKDHPAIEKIILWWDSCVPQNKNSFMSVALQSFLDLGSNNLQTIEQKFSEPGHGNIQEIDSAHSVIERHIRDQDIHSPLSLLRILKSIPPGKLTFKILQMQPQDYLNYQAVATQLQYKKVPYTQVKHLQYKKDEPFVVKYKTCFLDEFTAVRINKEVTLRKQESPVVNFKIIPKLTVNDLKSSISDAKKTALQSMLNTMPEEDKNFYMQTFLKSFHNLDDSSRPNKKNKVSAMTISSKNEQSSSTNTPKINKTKKVTRTLKF